jgi:hypothetical protein
MAVHPDDLPDDLMRDFVGSRYVVVMVRIGDDERPMNREHEFPGDHAVKMAGILCRDPEFWEWLELQKLVTTKDEKTCANWLSFYLGIESRKELKTDEDARELFNRLKASFEAWRKQ